MSLTLRPSCALTQCQEHEAKPSFTTIASILPTVSRRMLSIILCFVVLCAAIAPSAPAATIEMDLTCVLNGLGSGPCAAGPSFGTVTLEDLTGVDAGKVQVTVDLGMPVTQKFRDFMLNFAGTATSITDTDAGNNVVLNSNAYSINPYNGDFDLGATGGQGWNATTSGAYTTVLSGNSPLSTNDFLVLDTLGNLYAAIHIQAIGSATGGNCEGGGTACVPGMPGPGSLKIGAPDFRIVDHNIPEPTSMLLVALGGAGFLAARRGKR